MSKINKLGKSTFVIAILSFLLVAVLAFGGTYAYFSAKADTTKSTVTMGHLYLTDPTATLTASVDTAAVPNQPVLNGAASVTVTTNIKYYAKVTLTVESVKIDTDHDCDDKCTDQDLDLLVIDEDLPEGWVAGDDDNVWYLTTASNAGTIELPATITVNPLVGNGGSQHFMKATISFTITFQAVQAEYIDETMGDTVVEQIEAILAA